MPTDILQPVQLHEVTDFLAKLNELAERADASGQDMLALVLHAEHESLSHNVEMALDFEDDMGGDRD